MRWPLLVCTAALCAAQPPAAAPPKPEAAKAHSDSRRIELNLLGQVDTEAGESRRNENVQFNLVDNNALKELNVRLGTTATLIGEFDPARNYFAAEFGNAPSPVLHLRPAARAGAHGRAWWTHLNSVFSARSFFQVGAVQPARENDYGLALQAPLKRGWSLGLDSSQQKLRGQVNGNVLVPRPDERTALAADPATRALVERFLAAFPRALPNRTDIDPRALNTNSPQTIDNDAARLRLESPPLRGRRAIAEYQFLKQSVAAFQLVAGQNPDTDTRNHRARLTLEHPLNAATTYSLTAAFDRVGSLLVPEPNAVGPMISVAGLTTLGPSSVIPIDRAVNTFRFGAQLGHIRSRHNTILGFALLRRQLNGREVDAHRGYFSFGNDFGRDSITNFRLGLPTQHIISLGDVHRGFRNWDMQYYAGDTWRAHPALTLTLGLRYQPVTTPVEVNRLNTIPYPCDCNNLAPRLGLAWRVNPRAGVLRLAYSLDYGEIFPVTFQQVRFSPPLSVKIVVTAPSLANPLGSLAGAGPALGNLYLLAPDLRTPYSHQYNFAWEPALASRWRIQLGYVGSRSHKLLLMWYLNRAHAVEGVPQTTATINLRRPDAAYAEKRLVVNGSRGYFDAARATLVVPAWRGLALDASYWFSKAMDLGAAYSNTAYDQDSRNSRSQSEYDQHRDRRALSPFDQTHAFLLRAAWTVPGRQPARGRARLWRGWQTSAVVLLKSGTPFVVTTGSDGPGYGNVDGNGGDRPHLVDPGVLGRTVGHPDTSFALLPRAAFAYPRPWEEFGGNLGYNTFRKGGIYNVNAALERAFPLAADLSLTLRAESVNFLNTPQFAEPGAELSNPNFGRITNTLNDGRTFRLSLRFAW